MLVSDEECWNFIQVYSFKNILSQLATYQDSKKKNESPNITKKTYFETIHFSKLIYISETISKSLLCVKTKPKNPLLCALAILKLYTLVNRYHKLYTLVTCFVFLSSCYKFGTITSHLHNH